MERLTLDEFRALFGRHKDAFHVETKETYSVSSEDEPFRKFLAGEYDDDKWRESYFGVVREATNNGTSVRRARVVIEPLNDYARFLLHITPGNIRAGEDVRYLPRSKATGIELPEDGWLFDSEKLVFTVFDGRVTGFVTCDDPEQVHRYRAACSQIWERAVPYSEYVNSQ